MGWPPNDVHAVANRAFLRGHLVLRHLPEVVEMFSDAMLFFFVMFLVSHVI